MAPRVAAHKPQRVRATSRRSSEVVRRNRSLPGGRVIAPAPKRVASTFDTTRPRPDGSLLLGRRNLGPGELAMTRAGVLTLNGKRGPLAAVEAARLIETGVSPFRHATATQRAALIAQLTSHLEAPRAGKMSSQAVLQRSAAATLLLSLARTASGADRDAALDAYLGLLVRETFLPFKSSMLSNLEASHLPLKAAQRAQFDEAEGVVAPKSLAYDKMFRPGDPRPHLEVRQYVMDDFWREELRGNRRRGFRIVSQSENRVVFERTLRDPTGRAPDVSVRVVMQREDQNVLRDLNDPAVGMVIYSGHAQLGGIADSAIRAGPDQMVGEKLVAMFNCRGQQNVAQFKAKYPGAHLSATFSSSYGSDDTLVLDRLYDMIARRAGYGWVRSSLRQSEMLQPKSNYILPDDRRQLAFHDNDRDGLRDRSPIGPDRFFDPATLRAHGGIETFRPAAVSEDPQTLSGVKLDHAINYANTAFYYFSEENRAAPLRHSQADTFIPGQWFVSDSDEPVRVVERTRDGRVWYEISVNSRYAGQSREVITSMVLFEMQKYFCEKEGRFDADDKLRALVLVAGYLDLHADFSDQIDAVLAGFGRRYGFTGTLNYDLIFEALKRDGDHGTATRRTLDYLRARGIGVSA